MIIRRKNVRSYWVRVRAWHGRAFAAFLYTQMKLKISLSSIYGSYCDLYQAPATISGIREVHKPIRRKIVRNYRVRLRAWKGSVFTALKKTSRTGRRLFEKLLPFRNANRKAMERKCCAAQPPEALEGQEAAKRR